MQDEDGELVEKYGMAGFMGSTGSRIEYYLAPDPGGADEKGGLVDVEDLLGDGGEDIADGSGSGSGKDRKPGGKVADVPESHTKDGCTGRWNAPYTNQSVDKKDRDRWMHPKRGRWRAVTLS